MYNHFVFIKLIIAIFIIFLIVTFLKTDMFEATTETYFLIVQQIIVLSSSHHNICEKNSVYIS